MYKHSRFFSIYLTIICEVKKITKGVAFVLLFLATLYTNCNASCIDNCKNCSNMNVHTNILDKNLSDKRNIQPLDLKLTFKGNIYNFFYRTPTECTKDVNLKNMSENNQNKKCNEYSFISNDDELERLRKNLDAQFSKTCSCETILIDINKLDDFKKLTKKDEELIKRMQTTICTNSVPKKSFVHRNSFETTDIMQTVADIFARLTTGSLLA